MASRNALPLATLKNCFQLLCAEPGALMIDSHLVPDGLPCSRFRLDELRGRIDRLPQEARRAVLTVLVSRAQAGSPTWRVALAGLLLPDLQELADRLRAIDRAAAEAAALNWFRSALALPAPAAVRDLQWLLLIAGATNPTAVASLEPPPRTPRVVMAENGRNHQNRGVGRAAPWDLYLALRESDIYPTLRLAVRACAAF